MDLADRVIGSDTAVPLLGGGTRRYAHCDHAASTPPFAAVQQAVNEFTRWYANVHRGTGFKARLSSWAFDQARAAVLAFVGADPAHDIALFTRNTTEALNHVAQRCAVPRGSVVVTTLMEHHSNDLPWRRAASLVRVGVTASGTVDEDALRDALRTHRGRVALLAVSGASNVSGIVNPVRRWARWAHEAGARIVVDGAQLVPHRPVGVGPAGDPGHLDFLAFSAHKMYAPFGTGVLVGPRAFFAQGDPRLVGGGTVDIVDTERVVYTAPPDREEAGTPAVVGAVALAAAIAEIGRLGWPAIRAHEDALRAEALSGLRGIPGVRLYADDPPRATPSASAIAGPAAPGRVSAAEHGTAAAPNDRLGVIAFTVDGVPHGLVASALGEEWAIGTRSGCFCAHPYVKALLGIGPDEARAIEDRIVRGDRRDMPGAVRASFGLASAPDDAARLVAAVRAIASGAYDHGYTLDPSHGDWLHAGACSDFAAWFRHGGGATHA